MIDIRGRIRTRPRAWPARGHLCAHFRSVYGTLFSSYALRIRTRINRTRTSKNKRNILLLLPQVVLLMPVPPPMSLQELTNGKDRSASERERRWQRLRWWCRWERTQSKTLCMELVLMVVTWQRYVFQSGRMPFPQPPHLLLRTSTTVLKTARLHGELQFRPVP